MQLPDSKSWRNSTQPRKYKKPITHYRYSVLRFVRELYIREPASRNFRLTDLCLTYLTFDCLKFDLGEDQVQESVLNGDYAFLEYAAKNWLSHLRDLDWGRGPFDPAQYSDIQTKTKAVLDFHQRSRAQDYIPMADIGSYFLAFSDCPEIYLHPTLRDESHLNQGSCEGSPLNPPQAIRYPAMTPDMF